MSELMLPQPVYEFYRMIPIELHPALVHFPIGLLVAALLFNLLYIGTDRDSFESAGYWCLIFGALGGILAVFSGLAEEGTLGRVTDRARELLITHKSLGLGLLGLFALLMIWALIARGLPERARGLFVLLMLAGVVGLGYQGWLGGEMVFSEATGVNMDPMKQLVSQELAAPAAPAAPVAPVPPVPPVAPVGAAPTVPAEPAYATPVP